MEECMTKRGARLIVYVPKELDHHFAGEITEMVDKEIKKGCIKQLVFDFSKTTFYGQLRHWDVNGEKAAVKLQRRNRERYSC